MIGNVVGQSFAAIGLHRNYNADASTAMTLRMRPERISVTASTADGGALGDLGSVDPQ